MNAIELLKEDHNKVRKLLKQLSDTTDRAVVKRQELLDKIEQELSVHTQIEEEIFYPAFHEAGKKEHEKIFYEAHEEHRVVDDLLLPDTKETKPDSVQFSGRVKVLKEVVEHHANDEEKEMFPMAEKLFSADELQNLGQQMAERKKQLMQH